MKRACVLVLLLLASVAAFAQTGAIQGHSFLGGKQAVTQGASSTNYLDGIVPHATITVYLTGTTNLATLYADAAGTPLANPFTSNAVNAVNPGGWLFFAATNQGVDVVASGGIPPNTYSAPVTLCKDCYPSSSLSPVAGVTSVSATSPIQVNGGSGPAQGGVTVSCPTCGLGNAAVQAFVQAPVVGQYVVLYPTAAPTLTQSGTGNATSSADDNAPFSGQMTRTSSCSACTPPNYTSIVWTGTALPSYISPSNVTAIYGGFVSSAPAAPDMGSKAVSVNGTSVTGLNSLDTWEQGTYSVEIASGSGAQTFDYATVTWSAQDASSENWGHSPFSPGPITSVSTWTPILFVYYTGSAPPALTAVQVMPPLNLSNGQLSLIQPLDYGADTSGTANAYTVNLPGINSLNLGQSVCFMPHAANSSTTPTLNFNGSGGYTIVKAGGAALAANDLTTTAVACVRLGSDGWELQNPQTGGGGGVTSVSNSDSTLTVSPTTGAVVAALNLAHANTWTATQKQPAPILSNVTGSTQCLHVNSSGQVSGTGSDCGSGGGGGLPTANAAGQIISSAGAGTTYAVQGQVFFGQTGDTISSIESECSSLCTYVVTVPQTLTIAANHTLSANVNLQFLKGGEWTINGSGFTLTIPGTVSGTLTRHFAGSASIALGLGSSATYPEWFGAVNDWNGSTGTDNTTAINTALTDLGHGNVILQPGSCYSVSGTINLSKSGIGLIGTPAGPTLQLIHGGNSACVVETSTSATIVSVQGASSGSRIYTDLLQDINFSRSAAPTGTAIGVNVKWVDSSALRNVRSDDSFDLYYITTTANVNVVNSSGGWGYNGFSESGAGTYCGFCMDDAGGTQNASLVINNSFASSNGLSSLNTRALQITGTYISDVFVQQFEAFETAYGVYVSTPGGGSFHDDDLHCTDCILDSQYVGAIYVSGLAQGGEGSIHFQGGWANANSGTYVVDCESSSGFQMSGMQITANDTSGVADVYLHDCVNATLTGNHVMTGFGSSLSSSALILDGTTSSAITGNVLSTSHTGTLTNTIFENSSSSNTFTGNVLNGGATVGVSADSTSSNNRYLNLNTFDSGYTTDISDAGTGNQLPAFTPGGDLSGSNTSQEVIGIQGHALPSLAPGYPHWTGTAWVYDTPSGATSIPICADTSGSGTAQSCTTSPSFTPIAGSVIAYTTTTANTGASLTLNVNSSSAAAVAKWQGTTTLNAGDVKANIPVLATFDGSHWNLSTIGNAPASGSYPTPTTLTASSSAELDFDSCITGSNRNYEITLSDVVLSAAGTNLYLQFSSNGGSTWDTTSGNYNSGRTYVGLNLTGGSQTSNISDIGILIGGGNIGASTNYASNATFRLYNPASSNFKSINGNSDISGGSSTIYQISFGGVYKQTVAVNALRLIPGTGTIASGVATCQPLPQ